MSQEKELFSEHDDLVAKTFILIEDDGHLATTVVDLGYTTGVLGESRQEIENNLRTFAFFWLGRYNIADSRITYSIAKAGTDLLEITMSFPDGKGMEDLEEKTEMITRALFGWLSSMLTLAAIAPGNSITQKLN